MCLDELRRLRPGLGFALYALEAAGPVTLEVHDAGQVYTFEGPTAQSAITAAFPELAAEKFDTPIEHDDRGRADIPHFLRRPPAMAVVEELVSATPVPTVNEPLFPDEPEAPAASSVFD